MNNVDYTAQAAIYSGLAGYHSGSSTMQDASRNIARGKNTDINQSAVNLISGQTQAEASANVIKRADEMLGTIIDTFA